MFSSKFFLIIAAVTLLLIGTTLFFQISEAQTYNLLETLQERILGGGNDSAAVETTSAETSE